MRIGYVGRWAEGIFYVSVEGTTAKRVTTVWTVRRVRKERECALCGEPVLRGTRAVAPLGNEIYRYLRIHVACAEDAAAGAP